MLFRSQEGAAPDDWLTWLPQPLLINRRNLDKSGYYGDALFYHADLSEADLEGQDLAEPLLASYNKIMAEYIFRQNGTVSYSFMAYGQDSRGIPETLYHHLAIESIQPQAVADLLAQQKQALFWPEEGDL